MLVKNVRGHCDPLDLWRKQVLNSNGSQVDQKKVTSRDQILSQIECIKKGPTVGISHLKVFENLEHL